MSNPGHHISIGMSDSDEKLVSNSKPHKKLFLLLFTSFLLIAAVIGTVAGVNSKKNTIKSSSTHAIVKSSCSTTFYPDLCYSTIANATQLSNKVISTPKDVIMMSLNITKTAVEHNYFSVKRLLKKKKLTDREKTALHDCLEMIDETLDELRKAEKDLNQYPSYKKSLSQHADDLKTLMSTAMTNQETTTFYPDLCYSTIANAPELGNKAISTPKDVIATSLNATKTAVEKNYFSVKRLLKKKGLTGREKTALHDCLETIDETLDEIRKAEEDLNQYPSFNKSLTRNADDLKTLLSAAITNQETNALAMIKNMTDTDIANEIALKGRNLGENVEGGINEWPEWLSAGDRRLLQSTTVTPNVVVAADGSGNYRTVSAAVAAAPEGSSERYVIRIKAGVYRENVDVPKKKTNLMFLGDGRTTTIITASRNVVDGSTTFNSATVGK
ncbi:hypothetical protein RHGRI_025209 [Rhododendron griersonianum]|uniref:Pectinesterase n=1 Tax=Rhododendron griersonianum TaxID=479676 RepID=A0AAV6JCH0_9ERIC|nr:hypothetical protein RHGRI_025209 [Rhododendron griersonianum]